MNPWYIPSVPSIMLTVHDVCRSLGELFDQMKIKGIDSMSKAVQYSLIMTLESDYNAKEEKLFNDCTDSVVK